METLHENTLYERMKLARPGKSNQFFPDETAPKGWVNTLEAKKGASDIVLYREHSSGVGGTS